MKNHTQNLFNCMYQDTVIHFLLENEGDVMVNATEMAKIFNKQIDNFKRLEGTQHFISALLESENNKFVPSHVREQLTEKDLIYGTNKATFMHRKLAIYFAFWLDVKFQIWVIDVIDEIIFGNYKKHWEAHAIQETAKIRKEEAKQKLLAGDIDAAADYFEAEKDANDAARLKTKLIKAQYSLFKSDDIIH